ncbi:MAG: response regulator transcription factor [Bacillota bacterium]
MISIQDLLRLMIVDDHTLFRSGLRMLLQDENDMSIVAEAASAEEALSLLSEQEVDVVLMDLTLKGMDGLEAAQHIRERYPAVKVIVLTMHDDEAYLMKALKAGVQGYVLKEAATSELATAIRSVMDGQINIHPSLVNVLVNQAIGETKQESVLTKRETEVLQRICLGYTNREIADILVISVKTVEKHKEHIMTKLNLKRRHELIEYAFKQGLLVP